MCSLEDEINEIEKYIQTLNVNDDSSKEFDEYIKLGVDKGLFFDTIQNNYRATMISIDGIKKEERDYFIEYINRCEEEEYQKRKKWKEDIINSGDEYSKDELKYIKII
jgi:hypothetical protein